MALGRKLIVWDAGEMAKGASSSGSISDGGFSPETNQVNLVNTPGVAYQPAAAVDASDNLTGQIIASCEDATGTYKRLQISQDADQDGRVYSLSSANVLVAIGAEITTSDFIQGRTDMAAFGIEGYVSGSVYLVRVYDVASTPTINTTFFQFTDTVAPHPLLYFENNLYYGDGNLLHRQTVVGTAPSPSSPILTLPDNQIIVALGIDPGSGKMLISVVGQYNVSDTRNSDARVLYYDGFSPKVSKSVPVEQMITAFPSSEGGVYAAYGNNLGYWNGAGVTFLRNFSDITANNEQLLYKQHFTNVGSTLYFIVRTIVWAHGPIRQNGDHIFYPAMRNNQSGSSVDMTHINNIGDSTIGFSFATSKYYTWNSVSVATSPTLGSEIVSNENNFTEANDGIWLRRVRIYYKNQVNSAASPGTLSFYNEDGLINTIGNGGSFVLTNASGAAKAMIEIVVGGGAGLRVYQLQWRLALSSINPGIQRVEVFGDLANVTT